MASEPSAASKFGPGEIEGVARTRDRNPQASGPTAAYKQDVTLQDREPGEVDLSSFHDCPICEKTFFAFIDLYDHIARHRDEPKA